MSSRCQRADIQEAPCTLQWLRKTDGPQAFNRMALDLNDITTFLVSNERRVLDSMEVTCHFATIVRISFLIRCYGQNLKYAVCQLLQFALCWGLDLSFDICSLWPDETLISHCKHEVDKCSNVWQSDQHLGTYTVDVPYGVCISFTTLVLNVRISNLLAFSSQWRRRMIRLACSWCGSGTDTSIYIY